MADQQLTDQHRAMALARLAGLERELADISTWLAQLDEDQASIMLDCAARDATAASWQLERRRVTRSPRPGP